MEGRSNYHSHSLYCDGRAGMEDFVRFAVSRGFTSYGFSSHAPLPFPTAWTMEWDRMDDYLAEFRRLKEKYAGRIELYLGLEIDYLNEESHPAIDRFRRLPLDCRLGSVHLRDDAVRLYYERSRRMVELGGFDIVGHADKVHYNAACCRPGILDEPWYDRLVCDYFAEIARRGYQMEINTKAYEELGVFYPDVRYFPLLRELGVRMQVNSDAHYPERIASGMPEAFRALRRAGFNRISLGVQSSDDETLRRLGRVHTWQQVKDAVAACRKAGLDNISLDLIYGLPDQTLEQWENTLADALVLAPRHISCYGLKLEEGTPLYDRRESLSLPDGDLQADMYLYAVELLTQNGYQQYEISNFAQPGYESRHNLKYWMLEEYAGFGPGAYSDFGGVRYGYTRDLDGYIAGRLDLAESERISPQEREMEYIMLRLRTARGIDIREFENRFRQRFTPLAAILESCAAHGLARQTEPGWCLTPRGFLVSNRIIGDLQEELNREKVQRLARAAQGDYRVVE